MAFHCRTEVPFKSPHIVLFDAESHGIHDPDQLFRIGVAGARRWFERRKGLGEFTVLHQLARLFDFRLGRQSRRCGSRHGNGNKKTFHRIRRLGALPEGSLTGALSCLFSAAIAIAPPPAEAAEPDLESLRLAPDSFRPVSDDAAGLGRLLFYDPILSGNLNISCGTCHHHSLAGADAVSLAVGQGGAGIGRERTAPDGPHRVKRRMPRNSPALFNLGAAEVRHLMFDGRISEDDVYGNGFNTPAEEFLPPGLNSVLAAQSLFPMIGEIEMGGSPEQNEIAAAVNERIDYGWPLLVSRIRGVPGYGPLFAAAFDDVSSLQDITITHIANAIGDFVASEWRSFDSPFDRFIAGDTETLTDAQLSGLDLFFGKGGCSACHGGPLFTDHDFHALAIPPFGPGRIRRFDPHNRDVGRMGESDSLSDAYRFRTPSLRNVELTAPYGHNGAYADLKSVIRHHLDPLAGLESWDPSQAQLPDIPWLNHMDFLVLGDRLEMDRYRRAVDIRTISLTEREIADIAAFLTALTGEASVEGRLGRPDSVPSGLPVD